MADNRKKDKNREMFEEISSSKKQAYREGFFGHLLDRLRKQGVVGVAKGGLIRGYTDYKKEKGELLEKFEAYETVAAGSADTIEYYILLVLSCLIATVGLYQSSPAVIIGAMIVAPLMGPIFGFSASMLWGSGRLLRESITTLIKGTLIVLIVSAGLTFVIPGIQVTQEMLARKSPGLFDICIALACGFIGAYSFVNKRISSAIPGVAISVALMPPLCTVGIGLGLMDWDLTQGAALLFAINLIGISLAGLIVFYLVKLHPQARDKEAFSQAKHRAIGQIIASVIVIILISVPLVFFAIEATTTKIENEQIHTILAKEIPDDQVYSMTITRNPDININLIVLGEHKEITQARDRLQTNLFVDIHKPVTLNVYTIGVNE